MVELQQTFEVSQHRTCAVVDQPRSNQCCMPEPRRDEVALTKRMRELVILRPRFSYHQIGSLLQSEDWRASDTRLYRL